MAYDTKQKYIPLYTIATAYQKRIMRYFLKKIRQILKNTYLSHIMLKLNFQPFPTLITERLILREVSQTDALEMFALRSNPTLMQYIGKPLATKIEDAQELIQKMGDALAANDGITWAITLKDDPKLIGFVGYCCIQKEHYRAEIGYMLHPDYHRQGLLNEALPTVLAYSFDVLKVHSVEACLDPNNIASVGLLEKNNFTKEAHLKESYYFNGDFLDAAIYSLLKSQSI